MCSWFMHIISDGGESYESDIVLLIFLLVLLAYGYKSRLLLVVV